MKLKNNIYNYFFAKPCIMFMGILIVSGCARYTPQEYIKPAPKNIPDGVIYAQYYGTSTILLSDKYGPQGKDNSILIDGFISREGILSSILNFNFMKTKKNAIEFIDKKTIDTVLVAHSHFDHAKDSGAVANATGAQLIGSEYTLKIVDAIDEKKADTESPLEVGKFKITLIKSQHVQKSFSNKLLERLYLLTTFSPKYIRKGDPYSFYIEHPQTNILIVPSSNFPENWAISNNVKAETVFLSIGLLGEQSSDYIIKYWKSTVVDTCAKTVIPIHWDDFRVPLSKPLEITPDIINNVSKAMKIFNALAQIPICDGHKPAILFPKANIPFLLNFEN